MLPKNTLSRVFEYYAERMQDDVERAADEFFGDDFVVSEGGLFDIDQAYFNEWFLFDFCLKNGKTPLDDFYEKNPSHLSASTLRVYAELIKSVFGLFRVETVDIGKGMTLRPIGGKQTVYILESAGSKQVKVGDWIPYRYARIGDHFEGVNAMSIVLPLEFDASAERHFKKTFRSMDVRDFWRTFVSSHRSVDEKIDRMEATLDMQISAEEIEPAVQRAFDRCGLTPYLSTETLRYWCSELAHTEDFLKAPTALVAGLAQPGSEAPNREDMNELLHAFQIYINALPKKIFKGKSSAQMFSEGARSGRPPKFISSFLDPDIWNDAYDKGMLALRENDFHAAYPAFLKAAESLFEQRTTFRDVFRLYANAGVAALAVGDEYTGCRLFELADRINPHYAFATEQLKRYRKGQYDDLITLAWTNRFDEQLAAEKRLKRGVWAKKGTRLKNLLPKETPMERRLGMRIMTFLIQRNLPGTKRDKLASYKIRPSDEKKLAKAFEESVWYRYAHFLDTFRVNFNHPLERPTQATKIGVNES